MYFGIFYIQKERLIPGNYFRERQPPTDFLGEFEVNNTIISPNSPKNQSEDVNRDNKTSPGIIL